MLKRTIEYQDFDGNERKEDFYFNLTKTEITEMELSTQGGLGKMVDTIIQAQDGQRIINVFKSLIFKAYGEKSPDGRRFVKEDENGVPLAKAFSETLAYDFLFMELSTDPEKAAAFFNGIIPQNLTEDKPKQS